MRHNAFGEAYCTEYTELDDELLRHDLTPDMCFVDVFSDEDAGDVIFIAEIKRNSDAEVVCYAETSNTIFMKRLLTRAGFAPVDINFID